MSDNSVTREVKVRLSVDCSNVLKGLTRLQQQINNVSVKKLRDKLILAGKDDFLSGVKDNVAKLEQSYEKANKALQRYIDTESKKNIAYNSTENYKQLVKNVEQASRALQEYKQISNSLESITVSQPKYQKNNEDTKRLFEINKEFDDYRKQSAKEYNALIKEQTRERNRAAKEELKAQQQQEKAAQKQAKKSAEIDNVVKAYSNAKTAMAQFMQANGTDNLTKNEEFRKLSQNLRIATDNYNEYRRVVNANNAELNNKTAEKDKLANIKAVNKLKQEELKLQQEQQKAEAKNELSTTLARRVNEFKNYQTELAKVERQASKTYHALQSPDISSESRVLLQKQLDVLIKKYERLNRESVQFRKNVGISSSRGFYDLGHNLDYFMAKWRSRLASEMTGILTSYLAMIPSNIYHNLANLQQNRVNFAQVMPNAVAENQELMNEAMRSFNQIAADYGASVEEVVEAGRLWGRQYKDVAMVQALVRNSTKLSITDNMSLTSVNKALEATMQQYAVQLKDVNEAQAVSGKIVDSWAKLADNAIVTASDLAQANERSAGAAYQSGVSFDFLQAMIATMSAATGKAGGEVGRSIRSMLVSMNSNKAKKFFNELHIATTEIGTDGVRRVRSYEKVITDLMKKLQKHPKDVSNVILAMSGGKYQYNNVMALLKNYDQLMKNLEVVRSSQGWADEQVAIQYQTIGRQAKALTADLQQLMLTLDQSGASNGIVSILQGIREVVQYLTSIDPSRIKFFGYLTMSIMTLKAVRFVLVQLFQSIQAINGGFTIFNTLTQAVNTGTIKTSGYLRNMAVASMGLINNIAGLVSVLYALYTIFDSIDKQANKGYYAANFAKKAIEQKEAYDNFLVTLEQYRKAMNDEATAESERIQAKEKYKQACEELKNIVGEEAYARIMASGNIEEAVKAEIQMLNLKTLATKQEAIATLDSQINQTEAVAKGVWQRIQSYRTEILALQEVLKARESMYNNIMDSDAPKWIKNVAHTFLYRGIEEMRGDIDQYTNQINALAGQLNTTDVQISNWRRTKEALENNNNSNIDIQGGTGGITETENPEEYSQKGRDYTENAKRDANQAKRNQLWYDGDKQAKAYENSVRAVENIESQYGTTIESILAKGDIYAKHKVDLEEYGKSLEVFRKELIGKLDTQMELNPEIAAQVGYIANATDEQKLKNLEVNRELYQQLKTYNSIVTMINEVTNKIEENKGKVLDVNNKIQQSQKQLHEQRLQDIERENAYKTALINQPLNYKYEEQKRKLDLEKERQDYERHTNRIQELEQDLIHARASNNQVLIASIQASLDTEYQLRADNAKRIAELEYQKNLNIRQGLADITTSFLIEGNSLKDIWKKLWQDLAKEAIMRLFQIKTSSSFLGSLIGGFGGGGLFGGSSGGGAWNFGGSNFVSGGLFSNHTGTDVTRNPMEFGLRKMHSGGMVEQGRVGVVPKLRNDEVVRTLQVGEEVNSIQDRRSNEILASVAMKAMDAKNQQPTNVNIMALDSRSFAEYLNDNADILLGVLAKQGAMGRRV